MAAHIQYAQTLNFGTSETQGHVPMNIWLAFIYVIRNKKDPTRLLSKKRKKLLFRS